MNPVETVHGLLVFPWVLYMFVHTLVMLGSSSEPWLPVNHIIMRIDDLWAIGPWVAMELAQLLGAFIALTDAFSL